MERAVHSADSPAKDTVMCCESSTCVPQDEDLDVEGRVVNKKEKMFD